MSKKLLTILFATILCFALCACDGGETSGEVTIDEVTIEPETTEPETTEPETTEPETTEPETTELETTEPETTEPETTELETTEPETTEPETTEPETTESETTEPETTEEITTKDVVTNEELEALINEIESFLAGIAPEDYDGKSIFALSSALDSTRAVLDNSNATQSERDTAMDNLIKAKEDLIEIHYGKEVLETIKNVAPTISADGKKLVLPELNNDKFELSLYGSSNQAVIALDGTIYTPLVDTTVTVMYQVISKTNPNDIGRDDYTEIEIKIPGKYRAEAGDNAKPNVIPGLREWKGHKGNFVLSDTAKLVIGDASLRETAETIAYYFAEMLGREISIAEGTAQKGDIYLSLCDKKELGKEGYEIEIGDTVNVEAFEKKGILYAGTTLTQILAQDEKHTNIPKGLIRDYPEYEVRSFMLDVARIYLPMDYLKEVTRYMAYFKINEVRMHINDTNGEQYLKTAMAAFRVESKLYPEINSTLDPDKIYSQEEYRSYQKEMLKYGVDIITEIDTPAHSGFVKLYDPDMMLTHNNNSNNYIDLTNEDVLPFIKSLFDEFLDGDDPVIQSNKVHIGADEYPTQYAEYARAYVDELIRYVTGKGRQAAMWANLGGVRGLIGETPVSKDAIAYFWSPTYGGIDEMIGDGYPVVNNFGTWLYTVPGLGRDRIDMGKCYEQWEANYINLKVANGYADSIIAKSSPLMLGAEACFWYDYGARKTEFDIFDSIRDAIVLIAEKCWYGDRDADQTVEDFFERAEKVDAYAPGVNPARYVESKTDIVASYDFENVSGNTVKDNSGNGYDATLNGIKVVENSGSKVLQFDGEGYLSLPFNAMGHPYTVSFDLYLEQNPKKNAVLFIGKEGTMYLNFNGTGNLGFITHGNSYTFDCKLKTGTWLHIVMTCDDIATEIYVNGAYMGTDVIHNNTQHEQSSTFVLTTGEIGTGVVGKLDNFVISKKPVKYSGVSEELFENAGYTNVALNKPVEDSGNTFSNSWPVFGPNCAVDGEKITKIGLNNADNAYFTVDLQKLCKVYTIEILWHSQDPQYKVMVSQDGKKWTTVFENNSGVSQAKVIDFIKLDSPMEIKYVKYQCVKHAYVHNSIDELRVWSYDGSVEKLIAEAKKLVSDTSVNNNNRNFLNRLSANIELMEHINKSVSVENIAFAYSFLYKQVEMLKAGQTTCSSADISDLKELMLSSPDFNKISKEYRSEYEREYYYSIQAIMDIELDQSAVDASVRGLAKIFNSVYSTNVAKKKPVTNEKCDTQKPTGDPQRINDGHRGTYADGGEFPSTFEIDLGEVYSVSRINVFPHCDEKNPDAKKFYHFEVYVSVDGEEYTKVAEKLDDEIETINGYTYDYIHKIDARYVRIVMTYHSLNSSVHLRELEVYGVPAISE